MKYDFFDSKIEKEYLQNPTKSYSDISKSVGCSKSMVQKWFRVHNVHRDRIAQQKLNNTNRNKNILITEKVKEILIGTLLGDSSISKYRRCCESVKILNSRICCGHSLKQKEYVKYLCNLISNEGLKVNYTEDNISHKSKINDRCIETIGECRMDVVRNIAFNSWRDEWYPNDKKIVPKTISEYISPLTIAIWYMDDGSKNNSSYYLHTEGFTEDDVDYLRYILEEKYNLITSRHNLRGKPTIYISMKSRKHFTNLIKPYICESMMYKIWND
jgi:hypothetical protein